jgi:hypothetical protein
VNKANEAPSIDRQAIAEQVIVSAGNVLVSAGFSPEEIGAIFRQAADHLAPAVSRAPVPVSPDPQGLEAVRAAFRRSRAVADLQPLITQARARLPLDGDGPQLKDCFDLAMQMAPLLAQAQDALRALAKEAGLPVFATREEWMASAGATDPAGAPPPVCLDDFETAYRGAFEAIATVVEELLRREDGEAFAFLLGHLAENSVVIDRSLRLTIERGMALLRA